MNKFTLKPISIITALAISLFIIALSVKVTLAFRYLYYYDINHLNISQDSGVPADEIKLNYNTLIDYIQSNKITNLEFPTLTMSREGKIHFEEVKNIFIKMNYLLIISGIISIAGIILCLKRKTYVFLKWGSNLTLIIPIALFIPFAINFDKSFTLFHKIAFRNDYWEFDPDRDPIINFLPQNFFLHCTLMILFIIALLSIILRIIYKKKKNIR